MRIFSLREHYCESYGEYVVGSEATGRHTGYLVYGEVQAGQERSLTPNGHHEILLLLAGEAAIEKEGAVTSLAPEQVIVLDPDEVLVFRARTDCRYVVAGAHATAHGHG